MGNKINCCNFCYQEPLENLNTIESKVFNGKFTRNLDNETGSLNFNNYFIDNHSCTFESKMIHTSLNDCKSSAFAVTRKDCSFSIYDRAIICGRAQSNSKLKKLFNLNTQDFSSYEFAIVKIQRTFRQILSIKKVKLLGSIIKNNINSRLSREYNNAENQDISSYFSNKVREITLKITLQQNGNDMSYLYDHSRLRESVNNSIPIEKINYIIRKPLLRYHDESPVLIYTKLNNTAYYKGYLNSKLEPHFYGKLVFNDGSFYEGEFMNGLKEGRGRIIKSNGNIYFCSFKKNMMEGFGVFIGYQGTMYIGEWKNDIIEGQGTEYYKDGSYYFGSFINGRKSGNGKFCWNDGNSYLGTFNNDLIHGIGIYRWCDGKEYTGEWKNNMMDGKGKLTLPNNSFYEGAFKEGKKNGYGKFWWNDSKYFEGFWKDDKQHGKGSYFKDSKLIEGIWINGKITDYCN